MVLSKLLQIMLDVHAVREGFGKNSKTVQPYPTAERHCEKES